MKKLFSLFVTLLVTTSLWAYDFQVGQLYYNITSSSEPYTVEVTSESSSSPYNDGVAFASITIPETVIYKSKTYSVTSIGRHAFDSCSVLRYITIPNSVTSIGDYAFKNCSSLTSITIPNSVTSIEWHAFEGCTSLTSVTIGNRVTSIGNGAFENCSSLSSVTIGNSVTSIGSYAFENCSSIKSITIPNSVTHIGDNAFAYCSSLKSVTIGNSVTSIGDYAFLGCSSLTSIVIPNSVTSIGDAAFSDCSFTTPIYNAHCFAYMPRSCEGAYTIPDGIKQIAGGAFSGCSSLTSITIPNSITSIGGSAFYGTGIYNDKSNWDNNVLYYDNCLLETYRTISNAPISGAYTIKENTRLIAGHAFSDQYNLTSVTIPNSVTHIGDNAFRYCSSLTSVTIPNSVTSIGDDAFYHCSSLTSLTIGESVTSVGDDAFRYCSSLTSVTIPNSVTSIGDDAFYHCSSLTSLTIGESVTSIGDWAFYGCSGITSLTIPNSVTTIGFNAFSDCSGIASITCYAETPPNVKNSLGVSIFTPVYIPCASKSAYSEAYVWSEFMYYKYINFTVEVFTQNSQMGLAKVDIHTPCNTIIYATPNIGYHFTQWNDGNTDNPRSLVLTQDTTLTAEFAINTYTLTTKSDGNGNVTGNGTYNHGETINISAIANYGYHFSHWNDYNYDNPRKVQVTEDKTYTAYFDKNTYYISKNYDSNQGYVNGYSSGKYLDNITLTAEANYGYHFVQWSDGVTDNPRSFVLTQDTTFVAVFAPNNYTISTLSSDIERGTTSGDITTTYLDYVTISATANYGYHFSHWNDYNYDNPCKVQVTEDKTYTAYFDKNTYYITKNYDSNQGYVDGYSSGEYLDNITLTAEANYGYHFVQWSDGNTDNPRHFILTQDTTFTAEFALNTYMLTTKSNGTGNVTGNGTYNHGENVIISAIADIGYHFVRWSDGVTDNPRTVVLTQDTAFSAEFAQSFSGQCGDNLYWAYNESDQSIAITGTGDMYNYTSETQPWILFLEKIKKVTTDNTAASLGTSAFEGAIRLAEVHIGAKIDMIEANVFAGCDRLRNIYCYPTYPPIIRESSFARYDALLYIPCDYLDDYVFDNNWKRFENIQCAGAEKEEIESDGVDVDPSSTSVTMTWPTEENANTYTIEIMKGGALFCRLVFNTTGQLLNISFAPSRDGNNRPAQYAELVANGSGLRFTVTGLNERTHYTYDLRAKDKDENTIQSHSGEFTTKSNVTTDMDNIQSPTTTCQKILRDGQLIIIRDGVEYNAMGQEIH